jgi:WD40 repeat protein
MAAASTLGALRLEDTSSISTHQRNVENPWLVQSDDHIQTELDGHDAAIVKISMPKKSSVLLSASVDGIIKIWKIKSGTSAVAVLDAAKFTPSSRLDDKQEAKELSKVSKKSESNVCGAPVSMSKSAGRVVSAWADDLCERFVVDLE